MRKYYGIFFLMLYCSYAISQESIARLNKDSLKKILPQLSDTQRINTLNLLSMRIMFGEQVKGSKDSALQLADEALSLSKKLHYENGIGCAMLNQSIVSMGRGLDYRANLNNLRIAVPLLTGAKDWLMLASAYGYMGECYHYFGENDKAIAVLDSSIQLFKQMGDTTTAAWKMVDMAHSYADRGDYSEAYKAFHRCQELTRKTDTMLLSFAYTKTAALFSSASLPELAIDYVNKVLAFHPGINVHDPSKNNLPWPVGWAIRVAGEAYLQQNQVDSAYAIANFLDVPFNEQAPPDNLFYGHLYLAMKQYDKALVYFKQGYTKSQSSSYEIGHALHSIGLAETNLALKNYAAAIDYANEAVRVAEKMHALREKTIATGLLSQLYAAGKEYGKAYQYGERYKILNDSLAPEEYKRKLSLLQANDQLEMQRKEARLLASQNQLNQQQLKIQESTLKRKSMQLYFVIGVLLVLALLAILVTRNIKLARRKVQLQQLMEQVNAQQKVMELEKEKTELEMQALRAQMNPHFIFNCLSSINRFILINKTDEASDYLTKFSRLIRMALHNSEKPLITLESELEALRLYLDLERLRFKNAFGYSITFVNDIDVNTLYIPPMLIQPFAENAIWHGLMHKKGVGRLDIQLCEKDKMVTCIITDNGIGRNMAATLNSRSAEKNKSMGVDITAGRLALLNKSKSEAAVFNIEDLLDEAGNGCGTRVVLSIPCKELTEVVA